MTPLNTFTAQELQEKGWEITMHPDPAGSTKVYVRMQKTFGDDDDPQQTRYDTSLPLFATGEEAMIDAEHYGSAIEYGEEWRKWKPANAFFDKSALYQWISPQQLLQFEKMFPDCVNAAYDSALALVRSQIGELYDIQAILAGDSNEGTISVMRWMLTVLTAYNISSPAAKHSQTLLDNYDMVVRKLTEMKTGYSTLQNAPVVDDPDAWGTVYTQNRRKMLG